MLYALLWNHEGMCGRILLYICRYLGHRLEVDSLGGAKAITASTVMGTAAANPDRALR